MIAVNTRTETLVSLDLESDDDYLMDSVFKDYTEIATPPIQTSAALSDETSSIPPTPPPQTSNQPRPPTVIISSNSSEDLSKKNDDSGLKPKNESLQKKIETSTLLPKPSKSQSLSVQKEIADQEPLASTKQEIQDQKSPAPTKPDIVDQKVPTPKKQDIEAKLAAKLMESKIAVQAQNDAYSMIRAARKDALAMQVKILKKHYDTLIHSKNFKKTIPVSSTPDAITPSKRARDNIAIFYREYK